MTPVTWQPEVCPTCNRVLEGLGRYCPDCRAYVEDMAGATTDATPEARARKEIPDARLEDERKADARQAVEMLGWRVRDMEQGHRPFACRKCGAKIAGGTRAVLHLRRGRSDGHDGGARARIRVAADALAGRGLRLHRILRPVRVGQLACTAP